jgi:tetratricopeptide (TPR) repeat protein
MYEGQYEKAIEKFNFILNVNPNDNQGVRYLLPKCYIHLKKYEEFLLLDKKMDEADSLYYVFPKIAAYFKLGNIYQAKITYKLAKEKHPFVAEELVKKKHNFPHDEFDPPLYGDGAPTGSRQEAFNYWKETNQLWEKDRDLKKFFIENYA